MRCPAVGARRLCVRSPRLQHLEVEGDAANASGTGGDEARFKNNARQVDASVVRGRSAPHPPTTGPSTRRPHRLFLGPPRAPQVLSAEDICVARIQSSGVLTGPAEGRPPPAINRWPHESVERDFFHALYDAAPNEPCPTPTPPTSTPHSARGLSGTAPQGVAASGHARVRIGAPRARDGRGRARALVWRGGGGVAAAAAAGARLRQPCVKTAEPSHMRRLLGTLANEVETLGSLNISTIEYFAFSESELVVFNDGGRCAAQHHPLHDASSSTTPIGTATTPSARGAGLANYSLALDSTFTAAEVRAHRQHHRLGPARERGGGGADAWWHLPRQRPRQESHAHLALEGAALACPPRRRVSTLSRSPPPLRHPPPLRVGPPHAPRPTARPQLAFYTRLDVAGSTPAT